jgi:hypothetical protein
VAVRGWGTALETELNFCLSVSLDLMSALSTLGTCTTLDSLLENADVDTGVTIGLPGPEIDKEGFTMDIGATVLGIQGRLPDVNDGQFVARFMDNGMIRIDHTACPPFWLELLVRFRPINVKLNNKPLEEIEMPPLELP